MEIPKDDKYRMVGKRVKLTIEIDGKTLFYTGKILEDDGSNINFIDKFGIYYIFAKKNIIKLEEISEWSERQKRGK